MQRALNNFLDWVGKRTLPTLILFSALSVSGSAAFYSVSGLSKLFAGAAFQVIIMAGSLEIAKLVTATLLHQYWKELAFLLKTYLTIAVVVLMAITSMGIYGFLSAAYQDTFNQLMKRDNMIAFLQEKADFYQSDVTRYEKELQQISDNIATLSNAKATSIQVRDTTVVGGVRSTVSTAELRLSQGRITAEEANRKDIRAKRDQVADSLQKYQLEILELKSDTDVAGELGPLEYLSGLTGVPMDKIINWLLIVIVFVFDPLAISLVIASSFAFNRLRTKEVELEPELPSVEDEQEEWLEMNEGWEDDTMYPNEDDLEQLFQEQEIKDSEDEALEEERLAKLYKIYGESGSANEVTQSMYSDYQIEKEEEIDFDGDNKEIKEENSLESRLDYLKSELRKERVGGINKKYEKDLTNEIKLIETKLQQEGDEDDLTKTY